MRGRASRDEMGRVVGRWRRSGLSGAAFCRRNGIQAQRLSYWRRVVGDAGPARPRRRRRATAVLAPVHVLDLVSGASAGIDVVLASGDRLVLRAGVSREWLREVLLVVRERC